MTGAGGQGFAADRVGGRAVILQKKTQLAAQVRRGGAFDGWNKNFLEGIVGAEALKEEQPTPACQRVIGAARASETVSPTGCASAVIRPAGPFLVNIQASTNSSPTSADARRRSPGVLISTKLLASHRC